MNQVAGLEEMRFSPSSGLSLDLLGSNDPNIKREATQSMGKGSVEPHVITNALASPSPLIVQLSVFICKLGKSTAVLLSLSRGLLSWASNSYHLMNFSCSPYHLPSSGASPKVIWG